MLPTVRLHLCDILERQNYWDRQQMIGCQSLEVGGE